MQIVQHAAPLPPKSSWLELSVRRAPGLSHGHVRGQAWLHNPYGFNALALISPFAWRLWSAADGRSLAEVLRDLPDVAVERALAELPLLWRNGFLLSPGVNLQRPKGKSERVFNAWLHLTNACNLACPYCYIHKSTNHMEGHVSQRTLEAIEATAQSGDVERIHVRFAGGEPMLQFAQMQTFFADATRLCQANGVKFSAAVLTNGTLVPDGAIAWLQQNHVSVSVSIDGVGAVQDAMRPVKGGGASFARLEAGLDAYLAAGIRPYILITIGESNIDGLAELTDWLLQRDLPFRFSLVRDLEWGAGKLDDRHGAAEAEQHQATEQTMLVGEALARVQTAVAQAYDRVEAHLTREFAAGRRPQSSFRQQHKFCDLELWRPIEQACGAGKSYVAIAETGAVSPCQAALHHAGTQPIRAESLLSQARNQTQFLPFARKSLNAECARCQFKASCAGGCPLLLYRREGHVDGRSPYCEVFRAVIPRILHISALEMLLQRDASLRRTDAKVA
jgi:uncharacterized protein